METVQCNHCSAVVKGNYRFCPECGFELPHIEKKLEDKPEIAEYRQAERKFPLIPVAIFVVGLVVLFGVHYLWKSEPVASGNVDYNEEFVKIADEMNKSCPVQVDQETRLDNVVVLPMNTVQYNYSLVNMDKTASDVHSLKATLEPMIVETVKSNPQLEYFRSKRATLNYHYSDKNGKELFLISVSPDKYEKNQEDKESQEE